MYNSIISNNNKQLYYNVVLYLQIRSLLSTCLHTQWSGVEWSVLC